MLNYLKEGWLVILLGLLFGAALAGIDSRLAPIIAQNQKEETYGQIPELVPGADVAKTEEVQVGSVHALKVFDADGQHIGWVVPATGMGYSDRIKALIGLNAEARTITGVYVLEQKETPGLGSKIASPWNGQFDEKSVEPPLVVVKHDPRKDNQIEAISGATISSSALTRIVNRASEQFAAALHGEESASGDDAESHATDGNWKKDKQD
jgi:Na+-translocating ferredoxin:NAD+ oxidoreductase subunit G